MGVLSIILTILKIIGIILLCILGLLLFILLIVLFVPIRYKLKLNKTDDEKDSLDVKADITFLLHVVNAHIRFPSDELFTLRLLIFKLIPGKKSKNNNYSDKLSKKYIKKAVPNKKYKKDESDLPENTTEEQNTDEQQTQAITEELHDENVNNEDNYKDDIKEDDPTIKSFIDKVKDIIVNFEKKLEKIKKKISDIKKNIDFYLKILESETFKRAYENVKCQVKKIFKSILPRKIKGTVIYGNADPCTAGMIFGLYSTVYPYIGKSLIFIPEFEKETLVANLYIRGHICIFSVLVIALKVYFNKDVKRILKLFKNKEKHNG